LVQGCTRQAPPERAGPSATGRCGARPPSPSLLQRLQGRRGWMEAGLWLKSDGQFKGKNTSTGFSRD
jgi:hypothetical protein